MPEPLEARLRTLAADAAWPDTPDLRAAVLAGPAGRRAPAHRLTARLGSRRLAAALLAALVLLPAAGAVALPAARENVLEWLGPGGGGGQRGPAPPPRAPPQPAGD